MSKKKKITIAVIAVLALALLAVLIVWIMGLQKQEPELPTMEPIETTTEAPATEEPTTEAPTETETAPPELTDRAKELLAQNPDTVGYIYIEHTDVDNPIVFSGDNDFYLNHGFDKQPNREGAVFMDYRDIFGAIEAEQSNNIVLYGHNMANNHMFGSLRRYRQNPQYFKTAPFIHLESNYQEYTYVIFGLVITEGSAQATWRYWDMEELPSEAEFDAYVETVHQKNMAQIPVDVQYGDKLLTLSTCYSDADDSRFLVIARRLREGETTDTFADMLAE